MPRQLLYNVVKCAGLAQEDIASSLSCGTYENYHSVTRSMTTGDEGVSTEQSLFVYMKYTVVKIK